MVSGCLVSPPPASWMLWLQAPQGRGVHWPGGRGSGPAQPPTPREPQSPATSGLGFPICAVGEEGIGLLLTRHTK